MVENHWWEAHVIVKLLSLVPSCSGGRGVLLFFMAVTKSLTDQLKQIKTYSSFRFQTLGTHHSQGNRGIAGDTGEEGMC